MLVLSNPAISPKEVETGKSFYLSVSVSEISTNWQSLKIEMPKWQNVKTTYTTWKQVKQR